jgi:RNA polymerase sigma-70 factor (ECF subfamily)
MVRNGDTGVGHVEAQDRERQMRSIMTEYEGALLRYVCRILNNPTQAQDVVQNVFIKLFRKWNKAMDSSAQLKSWLYRVAHNEAVDLIRRESRRRALHEKHEEQRQIQGETGHGGPLTDDERKEMVLQLARKLHPREQQVLMLRLENGLSYHEISEVTGRSEGNVGNILHHAVKKLSASLKRAGAIA